VKVIRAYICAFCTANPLARAHIYRKRIDAARHEGRCFYNPETHSCGTCAFLGRQRKTCSAPKPGKPFTTACKSWKLRGER
jgi:hypothetical protein